MDGWIFYLNQRPILMPIALGICLLIALALKGRDFSRKPGG